MSDPRQHPVSRRALLGLIGAPIKSSASPLMHESAGRAAGLHCLYQLIEIAGAEPADLDRLLYGIRRLGFSGINVTYPYKEMIVGLLDDLSPGARMIGAVNTVVVRDGKLVGHNTDASGFARVVEPYLSSVKSGPVALIGAGGVGKAMAYALGECKVPEIRVFDADARKASSIAVIAGETRCVVCSSIEDALDGAFGVINGTPVGMLPNRDSPVPAQMLHAGMFVSDAVYSPLWTPLLLAARTAGALTMTGRDLAVAQGADAFELFTGLPAPIEVMGQAFDEVMELRVRPMQ